jgi:exoribonuclease II
LARTPKDGLVLYKGRPARVKEPGDDRLTIQLVDGATQKVRPKDIVVLHDGPCDPARLPTRLDDDLVLEADGVRELLVSEQETVSLQDLAGLLFSDPPTSQHVWCSWMLLNDGLLFDGTVEAIAARSDEDVTTERQARTEVARAAAAWEAFVERARQGQCVPEDADHLREVEALAEDRGPRSRLLRELGRSESPENAHALLLSMGWWDNTRIPHLRRHDLPLKSPETPVPELPTEERRDLTHLASFAIDDEGNTDPDDAVSLDADGALWVHVADVAALAPVDSPLDLEARGRGATLYLPTSPITMLPRPLVEHLGLGLHDRSPALSFRIEIDADGAITQVDVTPSWIQVERLSYAQADVILACEDSSASPLTAIHALTRRIHARRMQAGALDLRWPEARIHVDGVGTPDGPRIEIEPLEWLLSRDMVAEAMILAGEGAARYAAERDLPFPFSTQEAPDPDAVEKAESLQPGPAADFARRRCQRPGRVSGAPAPHSGLGVELYARATSPLRRYLDLVAHQQLRSVLGRGAPLDAATLVERVGAAEAVAGGVRGGESDARRHWTLLYLQQRPQWRGEGVLVDARGRRGPLLLPELALETSVPLPTGARPGDTFDVRVLSVDLPRQDLMLELQPR